MKIQVLTAAINDLEDGRLFYQQQGEHLGSYFLDSLFSDIDSLIIYAGIHYPSFVHQLIGYKLKIRCLTILQHVKHLKLIKSYFSHRIVKSSATMYDLIFFRVSSSSLFSPMKKYSPRDFVAQ